MALALAERDVGVPSQPSLSPGKRNQLEHQLVDQVLERLLEFASDSIGQKHLRFDERGRREKFSGLTAKKVDARLPARLGERDVKQDAGVDYHYGIPRSLSISSLHGALPRCSGRMTVYARIS